MFILKNHHKSKKNPCKCIYIVMIFITVNMLGNLSLPLDKFINYDIILLSKKKTGPKGSHLC